MFRLIKESSVVAAKSILAAVPGVKDRDPEAARKANFFARQFVDAIFALEFHGYESEVIGKTLESGGKKLLRGIESLLPDLR